MNNQRHCLATFIDLYRDRPCLWDPNHPNYRVKDARLGALQELLEIYKLVDSEANVDSVRTKLNTLRTVYNRERKRAATRLGGITTLWYFDRLSFLNDVISPLPDDNNPSFQNLKWEEEDSGPSSRRSSKIKQTTENIKFEVERLDTDDEEEDSTNYMEEPEIYDPSDRQESPEHVFLDIKHSPVSSAQNSSHRSLKRKARKETHCEDEIDSFVNTIAISLRKLKHPQQAIAQKLISDVIFFSKMEKLTEDTVISIPKFDAKAVMLNSSSST